ncbi:hypothetical protein M9Y10_042069 [Tritrichomonas musculus]|uniref:Vacuolar protein-sorting-associated protein 36 n=1 Tax=Tritrichomonas musculus TaxID=1915356 RepID=A0ABR2K651_9EUKA
MLNLEDSLWERVSFSMQGTPLHYPKEIVQAQFPDTSLTIPTLRFGEVGTLTITNERFIFLMYQRSYALSFKYKGKIISSQPAVFPDNQNFGVIKIKTEKKTFFTIQSYMVYINQLTEVIQKIIASHPAAKPSKKIFSSSSKIVSSQDIGGMNDIARREKDKSKQRSNTINSNISDLDKLKNAAAKLKEIARELAQKVNSNDSEQVQSLDNIYQIIGDDEGKNSSGKFDLARDFSECMARFFKSKDNISFVTPAEGFVIFNKIQLTKANSGLISPKELMQALNVIKDGSNYPIKVENMEIVHENGSKTSNPIIVEKGKSFSAISDRLSSLKDGEYVTAFSLSKQLNISNEIVKWYLEKAVSNKTVLLDSSYAGERYYKNRFLSFTPMKYK